MPKHWFYHQDDKLDVGFCNTVLAQTLIWLALADAICFCSTFHAKTLIQLVFAIPSIRKPRFRNPKCLDFDPEIGVENGMEPNLETTPNFLPSVPEKLSEWGPKSCQDRQKCDPGSPHVLPAAPNVAQVPPRWQNSTQGCQNGGTRPPKSQFWAPKKRQFSVPDVKMLGEQTPRRQRVSTHFKWEI